MNDTIESLDHEIEAAKYLLETLQKKRNQLRLKSFVKEYAPSAKVTRVVALIDWESCSDGSYCSCNEIELYSHKKIVRRVLEYDDDCFRDEDVECNGRDEDVFGMFMELAEQEGTPNKIEFVLRA